MTQIRVAAYARVSSKEQAEKELSIPAQLKAIRKYCHDKDFLQRFAGFSNSFIKNQQ